MLGRTHESELILSAITAGKHVLIEGPVGVGKTTLAKSVAERLKRPVVRIDGDSRYSEQKLVGWFDPPLVLKKGFVKAAFIPGPLVEAMKSGGILFLNELNRLPEGVQNVLLPALDEQRVTIPHLGVVNAHKNFRVIATQNPKEYVATTLLSEAIMDRFEWVYLDYLSETEEHKIIEGFLSTDRHSIASAIVRMMRATRSHEKIRRGASLRAGLSMAGMLAGKANSSITRERFCEAAVMAFTTRIEIDGEFRASEVILELARHFFGETQIPSLQAEISNKKKS